MLIEYANVAQKEADHGVFRRWFGDDYFDLIVWYDDAREITGFQLCYDRYFNPHAITWKKDSGAVHDSIDEGHVHNRVKMTPIMTADGYFPGDEVGRKFSEASRGVESAIRELVLEEIERCHRGQ